LTLSPSLHDVALCGQPFFCNSARRSQEGKLPFPDPTALDRRHRHGILMGKGDYVKGKKIGTGSFGTVFLATHKATGETCVLKEIALRGLSEKDLKMSMAEVDVLKKLRHENIVGYRDSFRDATQQTLNIVMEHAAGGDLGGLIRKRAQTGRRFTEPEVLKILSQCVDALSYCHHTCHLLHRDLKPQNIFLTADGDVKLGDFGISRSLTSTNAMARTQCGTPLFMSPELAGGMAYDIGADVWALGCVLWNVATLRQPWEDRVGPKGGMMELMRLITTSSLDMTVAKQKYSPELCALLESLLHRNASARPSCKVLLKHALIQRGLAYDGPAVPPPPAVAPTAKAPAAKHPSPSSPPPPLTPQQLPAVRVRVKPSPPPSNCDPPVYSASYGAHTPMTLTFGSVGAVPRALKKALPPVAAPAPRHTPQNPARAAARAAPMQAVAEEEAAFGCEAHVAAAAMQRSVRRKLQKQKAEKRPPPAAKAGRAPEPPALEGYAAAAMAKIDGLLGEARAIRGVEAPPAPKTPPPGTVRLTPAQRKANALAREREELANARRAQEAAIHGQRAYYDAEDSARAAQRAQRVAG